MPKTSKRRIAMVVRRYQAGRTRRSIGKELSMRPETVKLILERLGFAFIPERNNKLTVEQEREVVERYPVVKSGKVLAQQFGCDSVTILNIVKRAGIQPRRRGNVYREFSPEQVAEMSALYESGLSQLKVAARFGTAQPVVSRILREHGTTLRSAHLRRELHGSWRGGRVKVGRYEGVNVPRDSPFASMRQVGGYVLAHRLAMAKHLGRSLNANETVHHINGDGMDNRVENLQLRRGRHGRGEAFCCADCGSTNIVSVPLAEEERAS